MKASGVVARASISPWVIVYLLLTGCVLAGAALIFAYRGEALILTLPLLALLALYLVRTPVAALVVFVFAGAFKSSPLFGVLGEYVDITALLACVTLGSVLLSVARERSRLRPDIRVVTAWSLLCGFGVLSLAWTGAPQYGLSKTLAFVTLSLLAYAAPYVLALVDYRHAERTLWVAAIFSLVYSASVLPAGLSSLAEFKFVFVEGSNYLALGRIAGLGVITALLLLIPGGGKSLALGLVVTAVGSAALMLAAGRGPLVALVLTILLVALASIFFARYFDRKIALAGIVIIVLFWLVVANHLLPYTIETRLTVFWSGLTSPSNDYSAFERRVFWQDAADAFVSRPILGLGMGGFAAWATGSDTRVYTHNLFLEVLAELGVPGFLLVTYLLMIPVRGLAHLRRVRLTERQRLVTATLVGVTVYALVNAQFSGDLNDNRMLWMSLGLITGYLQALLRCQP